MLKKEKTLAKFWMRREKDEGGKKMETKYLPAL